MSYWNEERIKLALDGTFTRLNARGEIITQQVPVSYMPTHAQMVGKPRGPSDFSYAKWTEKEDAILKDLRARGVRMSQISKFMSRSEDSLKNRVSWLNQRQPGWE